MSTQREELLHSIRCFILTSPQVFDYGNQLLGHLLTTVRIQASSPLSLLTIIKISRNHPRRHRRATLRLS